ncbi:hypothetical protein AB1Y20_002424 [Prymnesium parvum]|uniref:Fe2OG dioxygenase domain-containing protein n=1 Tax=Prymnesium parvum TaxID=97485 RepID=A0AB34JB18_PRYPA
MEAVAALPRAAVRTDEVSLALVQRGGGRTEWVFTERAANAPPLARMHAGLEAMHACAQLHQSDPDTYWWWLADASLTFLGEELRARRFALVDGMLGPVAIRALRDEVREVRALGRLAASKLAGGRDGNKLTYTHSGVRGDLVGWFDGDEPELWRGGAFNKFLQKIDTMVAQLAEHVPDLVGISTRSKAMVTCYPGNGARYIKHCDNSCDTGRGERCNGRRLTVIMYLNEDWQPTDGGELRLYEPYAPKDKPPVADVQPLLDRLIMFYADYRVPHEVLPAHADRLAITVWYFDREEYAGARERGCSATDMLEQEAIENEIARFENRYGGKAERHRK